MIAAALAASAALAAAAPSGRVRYLEHCAGCHGFDGRSDGRLVPDLKDRAGWFLCERAGRDYVARLPNIASAGLKPADRAAVLNYVAFQLGGASAPPAAPRFTASELSRGRSTPLAATDLLAYRLAVVDGLVRRCGAPAALRTDYAPPLRLGRR